MNLYLVGHVTIVDPDVGSGNEGGYGLDLGGGITLAIRSEDEAVDLVESAVKVLARFTIRRALAEQLGPRVIDEAIRRRPPGSEAHPSGPPEPPFSHP